MSGELSTFDWIGYEKVQDSGDWHCPQHAVPPAAQYPTNGTINFLCKLPDRSTNSRSSRVETASNGDELEERQKARNRISDKFSISSVTLSVTLLAIVCFHPLRISN